MENLAKMIVQEAVKKAIKVKVFQFDMKKAIQILEKEHGNVIDGMFKITINDIEFTVNVSDHFVNVYIDTLEDPHKVIDKDWIITGIAGEHYPCKNDIFKKTYDIIGD